MKSFCKKFLVCSISIGISLIGNGAFAARKSPEPDMSTKLLPDSIKGFSKTSFIKNLQKQLSEKGITEALKLFDDVPKDYSDDVDLQIIKASLYLSSGKTADAQKIVTSLLAKNPKNVDVLNLAATLAKAQNKTADWNSYIKAVIAIDQYNPEANIALAQQQFSRKQYNSARSYYQKALTNDANNVDALFGLGKASYYLEDDDKAKSTFNKILAIDPDCADAYHYLGKLAAANGENKVARDYAYEAVKRDSWNYDYVMDYGMYERNLGHYSDAEKAWTRAIELEPDYFLAYAYRAGVYDEQDKFTEALNDYQMVIKTNPDYFYAYESIGILAIHEKNWKLARESFMKCYDYNKDNISYPLMVTYCYYMEKDSFNAKKYSDNVLRKLDRSTIDYQILRVYHDLAGEMPLPQKIAALTNGNKKGKMYFYLGLLYDMMGGTEASNKYFMEVVKLNSPQFFEYRIAEWKMGDLGNVKK
ncbi:MAG: tetratricopeptide repeat protein [Treponema sp.]|nr:tetratricopeptide repeat protein [Treponema sp.]